MYSAFMAFLLTFCLVLMQTGSLFADYTVELKNGRRITVKGYREENQTIIVQGMGGEFGIAKDQIKSITKNRRRQERGIVLPDYERPTTPISNMPNELEEKEGSDSEKTATKPTPGKVEVNEEEQAYRREIRQLNVELKTLSDQYLLLTRGKSGPEPSLLEGKAAIQARTADLQSRRKDAQHTPGAQGPNTGIGPRVHVPLPSYSAEEKKISEMRRRILQLKDKRDRLTQEMINKNFDTTDIPAQ